MRVSLSFFILILLAGLAALAVAYSPFPWAIALLFVALLMLGSALPSKGRPAVVVLVNGAALILALAAFEAYLGIQQRQGDGTRVEGTVNDETQPNDLLGYAPVENSRLTARKFYGNELIYDVVYSIGPGGLRIVPSSKAG